MRAPIGRVNGAFSEGPLAPSKPFTGSSSNNHVTRGGDYPMPVTKGGDFSREDTMDDDNDFAVMLRSRKKEANKIALKFQDSAMRMNKKIEEVKIEDFKQDSLPRNNSLYAKPQFSDEGNLAAAAPSIGGLYEKPDLLKDESSYTDEQHSEGEEGTGRQTTLDRNMIQLRTNIGKHNIQGRRTTGQEGEGEGEPRAADMDFESSDDNSYIYWSVQDVNHWLRKKGFGSYVDHFSYNKVNGRKLARLKKRDVMNLVSDNTKYKAIWAAIKELQNSDLIHIMPFKAHGGPSPKRRFSNHLTTEQTRTEHGHELHVRPTLHHMHLNDSGMPNQPRLVGFNSYANSFKRTKPSMLESGAMGSPGVLTEDDIKLLGRAQHEIKKREFILPKCCIYFTWCGIVIWCLGCVWVILIFGIQFDLKSDKAPVCANKSQCSEECLGDDSTYEDATGYELSIVYLDEVYEDPPNYDIDYELPELDTARWLLSFGISFTLSLFVFSFGSLFCVSLFYYFYYKSRIEVVADSSRMVREPTIASMVFKKNKRDTIIPKKVHWTALVNDPSGLLDVLRKNDEIIRDSARREG